MFRQTTLSTDEVHEDRSMRVAEWALALAAVLAAGVLALIR